MEKRIVLLAGMILFSWVNAGTAVPITSGNLLSNPGFELGVTDWSINPNILHTGPESLPGGTVAPSEGSNWYGLLLSFTNTFSVPIAVGPASAVQVVDVSGFSGISSVEVGADYFAVGEMLSGGGPLTMEPRLSVTFLDATSDPLASSNIVDMGTADIQGTVGMLDDTRTVITTVPAGTHFIRVGFDNRMLLQVGEEAQAWLGLDETFLSVTFEQTSFIVPEPATGPLWLGLIGMAGIRRRRSG